MLTAQMKKWSYNDKATVKKAGARRQNHRFSKVWRLIRSQYILPNINPSKFIKCVSSLKKSTGSGTKLYFFSFKIKFGSEKCLSNKEILY